jgi:hypothetical protein
MAQKEMDNSWAPFEIFPAQLVLWAEIYGDLLYLVFLSPAVQDIYCARWVRKDLEQIQICSVQFLSSI